MNEASDNIFLSAPVEPEDKGMRLDKFWRGFFRDFAFAAAAADCGRLRYL